MKTGQPQSVARKSEREEEDLLNKNKNTILC